MKKIALIALVIMLFCLNALAEALPQDPSTYLRTWEGGEDYGEAREYYLYLQSYEDGYFTVGLDVYRIWGFEGMSAAVIDDEPAAMLITDGNDPYTIRGRLEFGADQLTLDILESDFADLPTGAHIEFE